MRKLAGLLLLLLLALSSSAQAQTVSAIVAQPTNQIAAVGGSAVFSVITIDASCRSVWIFQGVHHFGGTGTSISYTINGVTAAMDGAQAQVDIYGCATAPAQLSNIVTLHVVPTAITVSVQIVNDDGTSPSVDCVISQIVTNADGTTTTTPVLDLNSGGGAAPTLTGSFPVDRTLNYRADLYVNGSILPVTQLISAPTLFAVFPNVSQMSAQVVLFASSGLVKSTNFTTQ